MHTHRYTQLCVYTQSVPVLLSARQVLGQKHLLLFVALLAQSICHFPRKAAGGHLSVIWEQKKLLGHFWSPEPRAQATLTTPTAPVRWGKSCVLEALPPLDLSFPPLGVHVYTHTHTPTHVRAPVQAVCASGFRLDGGGLVTKSCPTVATPLAVPPQAPLSMGFSRQEYWSGLPFPSPGNLPNPGIKPRSPAVQADSLPTELPGKPLDLGSGLTI